MSVAIIDLLTKVYQYAPSCAEAAAVDAYRAAAITFCERTRLWRADLTCVATTNPVPVVAYTASPLANKITLPADAELFEFGPMLVDGRKVDPGSIAEIDEKYPTWRTDTSTGTPSYFTQKQDDEIQFVPSFDTTATAAIKANVILKPTETAETIPSAIAAKYRTALAHGALGIVLSLPGQAFTNPSLAMYFTGKFEAELDHLFTKNTKGQQRARIRSKSNPF